ncbi:hypothetical protein [Prochlorococcus marinus]|nr:hypothetical protein [Prochlorococcus marinus]
MSSKNRDLFLVEQRDAIDSYFECITECSLGSEGVECTTRCLEVHLKSEE